MMANNNRNPNTQDKPDLEHVLKRRRQTLESHFAGMPSCKTLEEVTSMLETLKLEYSLSKQTEDWLRVTFEPVIAPRASGKPSKKRSEETAAPVLPMEEESLKASEELPLVTNLKKV
jgi:hypothetical protein